MREHCRETRSTDKGNPGPAALRKRKREDWRFWVLGVLLAALTVSGGTAGLALHNTGELASVERRDRDTNRNTAYRLCSRNKADRAYAHARERGIAIKGLPAPRPMSATERRIRVRVSRALMHTPLLSILDCKPNLTGHGARPLPIADQEAYMRAWAAGELSNEEIGVCPDSRVGPPLGNC